jgi:hypothetical protein
VIVDEMELISRLRDVDPLPPDVAERAMQTLRALWGQANLPARRTSRAPADSLKCVTRGDWQPRSSPLRRP